VTAWLLDVNVLIALLWPGHVHHVRASIWFGRNRSKGWATCAITQNGFARIIPQRVAGTTLSTALGLLESICSEPDHLFWPLDSSLTNLLPEIRRNLVGHQQLTDAILLDLAIRREGCLVTLDNEVNRLLPDHSPHPKSIEVIPA
jgi:hypothetical protein